MNRYGGNIQYGPEELAAYVDGELDGEAGEKIEAWLADHPEAEAEVESQRDLFRLWQESVPMEPAEPEWAGILDRVQGCVRAANQQRVERRSRRNRVAVLVAAAAAVVLALVTGPQLLSLMKAGTEGTAIAPRPAMDAPLVEDTFQVATAADVDIVSMHADDIGVLLVGEAPVRGPLVLLSSREVTMENIEPDEDNLVPRMQGDTTATPMVVAPDFAASERVP